MKCGQYRSNAKEKINRLDNFNKVSFAVDIKEAFVVSLLVWENQRGKFKLKQFDFSKLIFWSSQIKIHSLK